MWLYGEPVDMRKSFDGLYALARHGLKQDPLGGALFAFVNRRGNQTTFSIPINVGGDRVPRTRSAARRFRCTGEQAGEASKSST